MRTLRVASKRQCVAPPGVHRLQSGSVTSTTSPTERVGRYQLLEPIGIGPSGTVSRAKVFGVAGFERQFAVKRFHAELTTTAAMAAMLSAAARAYGSLEHPRIARMSEFGVAQGSTFTAVEYVVGLDALRLIAEARLAGATLAAGGALALVSQAARAVGYAHGRGLTHLGLAPTNVIITADGDIKITDFGILSATLPQRPIEVPRLANRIPYLAPEQLANEATSAATDVFALGVLAYELVTGNRTFRGDTPQQVASAIMAGPPPEPALPRPIVRVLQRCLARSPFERFPDARALADALDAAVRVAPVPGTRKDVGAQVKDTLDRLAALNEGQMSGVVALYVGTGPIRRLDDPGAARAAEPAADPADANAPPSLPTVPPPSPGAGATVPELRYPITTVPGLPPPPIPVPPGVADAAIPPAPAAPGPGASTLLGMGRGPTVIPTIRPTIRPRTSSATGLPVKSPGLPAAIPPAIPLHALRAGLRANDAAIPIEPATANARIDAANDGVHMIDPNDLESLESDDHADDVPSEVDDRGLPPGGSAAEGRRGLIDEPAEADERAAEWAEDSPDDPSDDRALPLPRPPSHAAPTRSMKATQRPDQNMADTQPIAPILLEPLLFDAIGRPDARPGNASGEPAAPEDDRASANRSGLTGGEAARTLEIGSFGPTVPAEPGADARFGRTMLGFASPLARAPAAPAAPAPPSPLDDEPLEPPVDETSEILSESFRTGGSGSGTESSPWTGSGQHDAETGGLPPADDGEPPEMPVPDGWVAPPPQPAATMPATAEHGRRMIWILVGMLGAALIGIGAWKMYGRPSHAPGAASPGPLAAAPADAGPPAVAPADPSRVTVALADAAAPPAIPPDAALVATIPADAARAATIPADAARTATIPVDAARAATIPADAGAAPRDASAAVALAPTAPGDTLKIASTPPGARVFLDGSDTGATPLSLPGSPDRHTIALLLAGHDLYIAQVDGHGTFQIPLKEITPSNGPAGIKVLRCKDKDRYYVFVDGKPTGQTCPSERIGCEVGPHTVEVYDIVSETRRKWDIVVKDTRLSFRIRVE